MVRPSETFPEFLERIAEEIRKGHPEKALLALETETPAGKERNPILRTLRGIAWFEAAQPLRAAREWEIARKRKVRGVETFLSLAYAGSFPVLAAAYLPEKGQPLPEPDHRLPFVLEPSPDFRSLLQEAMEAWIEALAQKVSRPAGEVRPALEAYQRAQALFYLDRLKGARKAAARAARLLPKWPDPLAWQAYVTALLGDRREAFRLLEAARERDPRDPFPLAFRLFLHALALEETEIHEVARELRTRLDPEKEREPERLTWLLLALGEAGEDETLAEVAQVLGRKYRAQSRKLPPELWLVLGASLINVGRIRPARKILKGIRKGRDLPPHLDLHLAPFFLLYLHSFLQQVSHFSRAPSTYPPRGLDGRLPTAFAWTRLFPLDTALPLETLSAPPFLPPTSFNWREQANFLSRRLRTRPYLTHLLHRLSCPPPNLEVKVPSLQLHLRWELLAFSGAFAIFKGTFPEARRRMREMVHRGYGPEELREGIVLAHLLAAEIRSTSLPRRIGDRELQPASVWPGGSPELTSLYVQVWEALREEDLERARTRLRELEGRASDLPPVRYLGGLLLIHEDRREEGEAILRELASRSPDLGSLYLTLAYLHLDDGDREGARRQLERFDRVPRVALEELWERRVLEVELAVSENDPEALEEALRQMAAFLFELEEGVPKEWVQLYLWYREWLPPESLLPLISRILPGEGLRRGR